MVLHPTAYSLRFGRSSRRSGFRRRLRFSVRLQPSREAYALSLEAKSSLFFSVLTLYISFG
jgi:hypothetical protein